MALRRETQKSEFIEKVVEIVNRRLTGPRAENAETFIRHYLANVPPDDLLNQPVENVYGGAISFWTFGSERLAGTPKVRVFNPTYDDHGWKTPHTVVEIVTDDMPFLVDSVTAAINQRDLAVHLVIHPILDVTRDETGALHRVAPAKTSATGRLVFQGQAESYMHVEISQQTAADAIDELRRGIEAVLRDVRAGVEDWPKMRERMAATIDDIANTPPGPEPDEVAEARALLLWLHDDNFTFLGCREYAFTGTGADQKLGVVPGSGLGLLRDDAFSVFDGLRNFDALPEDVQHFIRQPKILMINKSNAKSTVHRPVHMDAVFVKRFDENGAVTGERLFLGLFTSVAYSRSPREIPVLRKKIEMVMENAGFVRSSHDAKALQHILETAPRDELFQASVEELTDISLGILHLQERQRIAMFVRRDPFERFVSIQVYVPRDRFNTDLRLKFQSILGNAYGGTVQAFYTHVTDEALARIHFIVKTTPGNILDTPPEEVERRLIEAGRSWTDDLRNALISETGEERGLALYRRYGDAFATSYRERFNALDAIRDILQIETLLSGDHFGVSLYRPIEAEPRTLNLKVINATHEVALSDLLPIIEHMGLRVRGEIPYEMKISGFDGPVWIHDFQTLTEDGRPVDLAEIRTAFETAFAKVWLGEIEDDGFNRLVTAAGLDWRDIVAIRAYAKYLKQAGTTFSQSYIEATLARHPAAAKLLCALFHVRFDPRQSDRTAREQALLEEIATLLDGISNADEDRMLRSVLNLVEATLRTNFYQRQPDGSPKPYLSLKFDSAKIDGLPKPRPFREIFVYSPRMEGVHLRGGKVARGGIRWSDRREDFRTEILGLVKAQMVKNAVIVPVGSKGGFVVKRPPQSGGREAFLAEGIECYKTLMRGLLDITDNIVKGEVVPPADVVRHDDDDPYLVVAADKGTATFSDIANGVSKEYGFWLDDAFASGGSAGYDHKKMGITARGAWEAVKRHFREMGKDIQITPFTVIGVGDMSGDVFGNGMLLSRQTRLLGAFNHLHIFVDPNPDPERSWHERKRLFDLPRSAWTDYDASLISKGGGIFERTAKTLALTPEIKALFGIKADKVTPNELLRAMLMAEVELLWFGGIGTYVKAGRETNADVGDRANDGIRVNGGDLRCAVIGEGANLGMTQLGRIEFAISGGRLNTDAVDNSAGVDCSDHEVNIKILLGAVVAAGDMTLKQRDTLLEQMTDEVGHLVLRDNYLQTLALSSTQDRGLALLDQQIRLMRQLERAGRLDRALEFLPDDEEIADRRARRQGLTRPELAVLLAYAKLFLYDALLQSDLPDDPLLVSDLKRYFPKVLQKSFETEIAEHTLRREIIATFVTNSMVNRAGTTFVSEMMEITGCAPSDIARAYAIVRDACGLRPLWTEIEALDNKVPAQVQHAMLFEVSRIISRLTVWFLRNGKHPLDITETLEAFGPGLTRLGEIIPEIMSRDNLKVVEGRLKRFRDAAVPDDLAIRIAHLTQISAGCDIVRIGQQTGASVDTVGRIFYALGTLFGFDWLRKAASLLPTDNQWQDMAVTAIIEDLVANQVELTQRVIVACGSCDQSMAVPIDDDPSDLPAIRQWAESRQLVVDRMKTMLEELRGAGTVDFAMLAVANRQLRILLAE